MDRRLQVFRCKPNPRGRDKTPDGAIPLTQLAAEWVDIKNTGSSGVNLHRIELRHIAYIDSRPVWHNVRLLSGTLPSGEILRVHSGIKLEASEMLDVDRTGAQHHLFTGHPRYVWNNKEGDTARLWDRDRDSVIDEASYAPLPPDGAILHRVGKELVVSRGGRL